MQQAINVLPTHVERVQTRGQVLLAAFFLALMGAGLVFAAGFAGPQMLHEKAHDMRHANGFPCH